MSTPAPQVWVITEPGWDVETPMGVTTSPTVAAMAENMCQGRYAVYKLPLFQTSQDFILWLDQQRADEGRP